jgi:hypothetical protein
MNTMNNLSHDSRSSGRDLESRPPEYEAGVLTTQPRQSVTPTVILKFQARNFIICCLCVCLFSRSFLFYFFLVLILSPALA